MFSFNGLIKCEEGDITAVTAIITLLPRLVGVQPCGGQEGCVTRPRWNQAALPSDFSDHRPSPGEHFLSCLSPPHATSVLLSLTDAPPHCTLPGPCYVSAV